MRILGLDHVSVTTGDIARSLAFYRDLLELPVRSVGELSGDEVERITGVPGARLLSADLDLGRGQVLELLEYVGAGGRRGARARSSRLRPHRAARSTTSTRSTASSSMPAGR